jgi:hypothetical protein
MTQIQNVAGTPAGVTNDYRAMVEGFGRDYHLACTLAGWGFSMFDATVTPTAPGDYFAKLQNFSADKLYITGITIVDVGAELINVMVSPAFASGGTHAVVVPVNRYSGSANLAATKAVCESDVDITGSTDTQIGTIAVGAGTEHSVDYSDAPIILGPNQALVLQAATGTAAIRYTIDFYFGVVAIENS